MIQNTHNLQAHVLSPSTVELYCKFYQSAECSLVLLVCGPLATFPSLSSDELCSFIPAVTEAFLKKIVYA